MAYRRRRKTKYTWFPVNSTELESTEPGTFINPNGLDFNLSAVLEGTTKIVPITADLPRDEVIDTSSPGVLSDAVGQEWFLRRLVGKLFCRWDPSSAGGDTANSVKITAGFFVARADHLDPDYPLGGLATWNNNLNPNQFNSFGPDAAATLREPWIWRRCWLLGNPDIATDTNWPRGLFPAHNAGFASSLDGPHIDAKTLRRISNDDRLYFAIGARSWPLGTSSGGAVEAHLDLRVLGALRKARNRGVF